MRPSLKNAATIPLERGPPVPRRPISPNVPTMTETPHAVSARALYARLVADMQPYALEVLDETWQHQGHAGARGLQEGTHFRVRIGAPALEGIRAVVAHRLVYESLRPFIDQGLHALAIEILPPNYE